ncbi:MAG: response regulator [Luteolibacter sp.]
MSPSPDSGNSSEKLRVLVVDDEPTLRLGFSYALSNRTTTVETAANGRHALERISTLNFDLMILDLRMPEMDGIGVIETLRSQGNRIPVVLCTAMLNPSSALRAIRQGVVDFLLKPVRPADLRQVLEFVIRPENQPLSLAMRAMRSGRNEEAIRLLESAPTSGRLASCWLDILRSLRDGASDGDTAQLEDRIRTNLPILAFNGSSI